jgi:hypothetical protein
VVAPPHADASCGRTATLASRCCRHLGRLPPISCKLGRCGGDSFVSPDDRFESAADARDTALQNSDAYSHRCAGEEALLDDGVNAPVAVDHLGYAEVDSDRDERNRLVLGQSFGFHEERAHLAESVF